MQKTYTLQGTLNDFSRENLITQVSELPGVQGAELSQSEKSAENWHLEVTGELISDEWVEGTVESSGLIVDEKD